MNLEPPFYTWEAPKQLKTHRELRNIYFKFYFSHQFKKKLWPKMSKLTVNPSLRITDITKEIIIVNSQFSIFNFTFKLLIEICFYSVTNWSYQLFLITAKLWNYRISLKKFTELTGTELVYLQVNRWQHQILKKFNVRNYWTRTVLIIRLQRRTNIFSRRRWKVFLYLCQILKCFIYLLNWNFCMIRISDIGQQGHLSILVTLWKWSNEIIVLRRMNRQSLSCFKIW